MIERLLLRRNRLADPPVDRRNTPAVLPAGELAVLSVEALIERTGTRNVFEALRTKLGLPD